MYNMKKSTNSLQPLSVSQFNTFWDKHKTGDDTTISRQLVEAFFAPYIRLLPKFVYGEYFWHVFSNTKPIARILLAEGNIENIIPVKAEEIYGVEPNQFFSFFHPDDVKQTFAFLAHMLTLLTSADETQREAINFCIYLRVRNSKGAYNWCSMQYPATFFQSDGTILLSMVVYTQVNHLASQLTEPILTILDSTNQHHQIFSCFKEVNHAIVSYQYPRLSSREQEIIAHLSKGKSSKQIADVLGISKNTVDNHRQRLLKKFKVNSSAELVLKASLG